MRDYWLETYTGDSAVVRWRRVEQGTIFNVRLVGDDGSDTACVTSDTSFTFTRLSDSVHYNVMLRKQCQYCTSNYNETVSGEWSAPISFGPVIVPDTSGDGGNNDTIDVEDPEGIEWIGAEGEWRVRPNPARGSARVTLPEAALGGRLSLCDLAGRELAVFDIRATSIDVDVSKLAPGVYLLKLATSHGISTRRLLVE